MPGGAARAFRFLELVAADDLLLDQDFGEGQFGWHKGSDESGNSARFPSRRFRTLSVWLAWFRNATFRGRGERAIQTCRRSMDKAQRRRSEKTPSLQPNGPAAEDQAAGLRAMKNALDRLPGQGVEGIGEDSR